MSAQAKGTAAADEMRRVITLIVFFGFPEANDPLSPLNAMTLAPDSHTHGPWILASVEREFLLLLTDGERQGDSRRSSSSGIFLMPQQHKHTTVDGKSIA